MTTATACVATRMLLCVLLGLPIGCGSAGPAPARDETPIAQTSPATSGDSTAGAGASKVNMDEVFPAGPGRELVLNNCQNCHTFVPIVILQMNEEAWTRNSRDHRDRVSGLSDDDFKTLYAYLKANFNPNRSVPKLPRELLESWTTS